MKNTRDRNRLIQSEKSISLRALPWIWPRADRWWESERMLRLLDFLADDDGYVSIGRTDLAILLGTSIKKIDSLLRATVSQKDLLWLSCAECRKAGFPVGLAGASDAGPIAVRLGYRGVFPRLPADWVRGGRLTLRPTPSED